MSAHKKNIFTKYLWRWIGGGLVVIIFSVVVFRIYSPERVQDVMPDLGSLTSGQLQKLDVKTLHSSSPSSYYTDEATIASLEKVYATTQDQGVALTLIDTYLKNNEFDKALTLTKDVYHDNIDTTKIPLPLLLYMIFNSSQLSVSNIPVVEKLLQDYHKDSRIDNDTYRLYHGLLSLYSGDELTFSEEIANLDASGEYASLVQDVNHAYQLGEEATQMTGVYTDGLISLTLLQNGYIRVAQKLAVTARQENDKYILPYQVLAQSALLQHDRQEAASYYETLLSMDTTQADQYQFGLCISYFRQKDYDSSLLHCQQVHTPAWIRDALRYIVLISHEQKNNEWMMEAFQMLLAKAAALKTDYYVFFDIVFYEPFTTDRHFDAADAYYLKTVLPYLGSCVQKFGATDSVCQYGEAWFYLYKNDLEKAHKELLLLATHAPNSYVFTALADYYAIQGDQDKAKAYYMKALMQTPSASAVGSWTWNSSLNN